MEDADISLGDVSKGLGAASKMTKSLPGMTGGKGDEGSTEPKTCPTCNQRIVTSQPGGSAMDTAGNAIENADKAMDCCNKMFDCFGKVDDLSQKTGITAE